LFPSHSKDLRGEIVKVAAFLNQTPSDEQLDKITEHLRFDNFEKNESVNNEIGKKLGMMYPDGKFIRKGN
jgi:estrone sulfotransferase